MHCAAHTFQASDWPQIVALYDQLFSVMPTPVVALNRAIAVVEIEGPAAALTTLDAIAPDLDTCHLMHCSPRHDVASARTTRRRGGSVRTRRPPRSDRKDRRFLAQQIEELADEEALMQPPSESTGSTKETSVR